MRVNKTVRAKAKLFSKVSDFIEQNNLSLILNDLDVLKSDKMYFVERGRDLKEKKLMFLDYLYLGLALPEEFESEMLLMDISTSSFYFKDGELVYASEEPFKFDEDFERYMVYEEQRDRYLKAKEQIKKEVKLVSEFVKSLKITSDKEIYNTYNTCHLDSVKGKGKDKKGNEIKLKLVSETFKNTFDEVDIYYYDLKNQTAYRFSDNHSK